MSNDPLAPFSSVKSAVGVLLSDIDNDNKQANEEAERVRAMNETDAANRLVVDDIAKKAIVTARVILNGIRREMVAKRAFAALMEETGSSLPAMPTSDRQIILLIGLILDLPKMDNVKRMGEIGFWREVYTNGIGAPVIMAYASAYNAEYGADPNKRIFLGEVSLHPSVNADVDAEIAQLVTKALESIRYR